MEPKEIYFDTRKSALQFIVGIIILLSIFIIPSIFKLVSLFLGGSLIYFSSKGLSSKPQLIFSEKGLFVGFKKDKMIPIHQIINISIKTHKVDFRTMDFITIKRNIKSKSKVKSTVSEYPISYLDIKKGELDLIIYDFLEFKNQ